MSPSRSIISAFSAASRGPARLWDVPHLPPIAVLCALAIVGVSALACWLTGRVWPGVLVDAGGLMAGAALAGSTIGKLRHALAVADAQHEALEKTLHQAQKMEAIGRLTAGIAHDFNNHLTVISSNIELTVTRLDGGEERLLRQLDAAMQGVQRAAALSARLLTFARRPAVEPEAVDVNGLVSGLSDLLRRTLGDRVQLEVRLPPQPWLVWADANRLENAILSLVVNAREQVRDGGTLLLSVGQAGGDALHPVLTAGEYVQIVVTAGTLSPPHWSAASGPSHADLSMVRRFARQAGGGLQWSDHAACLLLPRHVPPSLRRSAGQRRAWDGATILLVEDEPAVRAACAEGLRERGYAVLEAPDAMEAFRLLADHGGIDMLLTDLGLPGGVSGRMLADAARHADPAIRVLFTTGYDASSVAMEAGAEVLRKPFDSASLAQAVQAVLGDAVGVGSDPAPVGPVLAGSALAERCEAGED